MILVQKLQIPTLPTEKPRRLYIWLPKGYEDSEERYPVLYMFDGHNVFYNSHATYGKSWGMKEYLTKTRLPLIVAAVECNHEGMERLSEYSPWDFSARRYGTFEGRGRVTMDWFVDVLKPEIDRRFRTLPDRAHTLIAGSSMGGLMALYAVTAYNRVFSRAAALSPSLWVDRKSLAALLRDTPLTPATRVYLDMGGCEGAEIPGIRPCEALFTAARRLVGAGAEVAARVAPGALHREADWEKRIPIFLPYLLAEEPKKPPQPAGIREPEGKEQLL